MPISTLGSTQKQGYSNLNLPNLNETKKSQISPKRAKELSEAFQSILNNGNDLPVEHLDRILRKTGLNQDQKIALALTQALGPEMIKVSEPARVLLMKFDRITVEGFKSTVLSKDKNINAKINLIIDQVKDGSYPFKELRVIANLRPIIRSGFNSLGGSADVKGSVSPASISLNQIKNSHGARPAVEASRKFLAKRGLAVALSCNDNLGPERFSGISLEDVSQYVNKLTLGLSSNEIRKLGNEILTSEKEEIARISNKVGPELTTLLLDYHKAFGDNQIHTKILEYRKSDADFYARNKNVIEVAIGMYQELEKFAEGGYFSKEINPNSFRKFIESLEKGSKNHNKAMEILKEAQASKKEEVLEKAEDTSPKKSKQRRFYAHP